DQDDQQQRQPGLDQAEDRAALGHLDVVALGQVALGVLLLQRGGELLALVADPGGLQRLPLLGRDLDGLVGVDQQGRLDLAALDKADYLRRVGLLVRRARARVAVQEEEQQEDDENSDERPAEVALQIHRRTTALVAGRTLLT